MTEIKGSRSISFSIPLIIIVFLVLLFFTFPQNILISRILSQEISSLQNENIRKITKSMKESLVLELEANEFILRGYGIGLSGEKQILINIQEGDNESAVNYANNVVTKVKESNPHFETVFIADSDGRVLVSSDESIIGADISEREYFQAILLVGNNLYTTPKPLVSKSIGESTIVHATSISQNGEIIGLLGASLNLDRLGHELILSKQLGETGEPFVLDREGHYLISNDESLLMTRAQDRDPLYQMILDSPLSSQTTTVTVDGEIYHAAFEKYSGLNWTVGLTMAERELYESVYTIRRTMFLLTCILIIAVSLILFFYIRLRLVKKILSVEDLISKASRGNLSERGQLKGQDEITGMAENFNGLLNSLSSFFAHLNESMENLDAVGYDLSSHMEETAAAVYEIRTNVENSQSQISKQEESVNSTVSTVEQISRSIESLERNIELQNQNIEQGSAGVEQMIGQIKSVSASMKTAEDLMDVLSRSSDEGQDNVKGVTGLVGDIANKSHELEEANALISGIASQTNLLAMNAAIEAAHAGDAGRGFAVVADEIRKLAEQSSTQSKQVKSTISDINGMIKKVVEGSQSSNDSFDRIHINVEQMNRITGEMTVSMAEQVTGSEQVLASLGQLKDSGLEVSRGSHEMTQGNEVILKSVEELSHISREVSQAMTEISRGIEEINHSVDSVSEITRLNNENISAVREEAGYFKLEAAPEGDTPEGDTIENEAAELPLPNESDHLLAEISLESEEQTAPAPLVLSDNDQVTDLEPEEEL